MTSTCVYPCDRCQCTIEDWSDENPFCQQCGMIEKTEKDYRDSHPTSKVSWLLNRHIENAILSTNGECGDCGRTSKYLIVEKKDIDLCTECGKDKIPSNEYLKAWYWCGVCSVG